MEQESREQEQKSQYWKDQVEKMKELESSFENEIRTTNKKMTSLQKKKDELEKEIQKL